MDVEHLAEEIEDLGKRDYRKTRSQLRILVQLITRKIQPELYSESWRASVLNSRQEILDTLDDSPSLRPRLASDIANACQAAVEIALAGSNVSVNPLDSLQL